MTILFLQLKRYYKTIFASIILFLGGMIYLLYRQQSLLMFRWVETIGLNDTLQELRARFYIENTQSWVFNALPNGLWLLAYMCIIDNIWNDHKYFYYYFLYAMPVFAIISEIFQYFHLVSGEFDYVDLFCYFGAIAIFNFIKFVEQ